MFSLNSIFNAHMYVPVEIRSLIIKNLQDQLRKERYERNKKKLECELRFPMLYMTHSGPPFTCMYSLRSEDRKGNHYWNIGDGKKIHSYIISLKVH